MRIYWCKKCGQVCTKAVKSASVVVLSYILDYHKQNDGMRGFIKGVLFFYIRG